MVSITEMKMATCQPIWIVLVVKKGTKTISKTTVQISNAEQTVAEVLSEQNIGADNSGKLVVYGYR